MNLSPHFTLSELDREGCATTAQRLALETLAVGCLEQIRAVLGVPLTINSGLRSAAHNNAIGGAATSQHLRGEAADFVPVGYPGGGEAAMRVLVAEVMAGRLVVDQLILYASGFLHVSYRTGTNRGQLMRSAARGGSGGPYSAWAL